MDGIRTERLHREVFRLYSEPGPRRVTVRDIVRAARVPSNLIYHWYDDIETLYRMAVGERIAAMAAPLAWTPEPGRSARGLIADYARICADLLASDDYRRLLYMVVRDGAALPWLAGKHDSAIVEAMQAGLARVVGAAEPPVGARLEIRASAARAFVSGLQGELALPMLLPGRKPPTHLKVKAAAERAAAEAAGAVYSSGLVIAALEQFAARRSQRPEPVPAEDFRLAAGA